MGRSPEVARSGKRRHVSTTPIRSTSYPESSHLREPYGSHTHAVTASERGIAPAWSRDMGSQCHSQFRDHKYIHSL